MSGTNKKNRKTALTKRTKSGLFKFIERPVPTNREVESFERVVRKKARNREIETNLSEIYRDKKGKLINVKKMNIKKRQIYLVRLLRRLLIWAIILATIYFAWLFFFAQGNNSNALELKIIAPDKIVAGEEFSYSIDYFNPSKFSLSKINLEIQYPENFIFSSSSLSPQSGDYGWNLPKLKAGGRGVLTITGELIAKPDSINVISARLSYIPQNFSSNFKKEVSSSTTISDLGFKASLETNETAFIGQNNEASILLSNIDQNYLGDFTLVFDPPEGVEVSLNIKEDQKKGEKSLKIVKGQGFSWQINGLNKELGRQKIPIIFTIADNLEKMNMPVRLEKKMADGQAYTFWEGTINPELVKSDLNLTLFLDGSRNDQAVNFGQTLNYTLSYSNKGDNTFKDVSILASLDGDFLDWSSLKNSQGAELGDNSLTWTKKEIPDLAEIAPGGEGKINFSIKLKEFKPSEIGQSLKITTYAQYGFDNKPIKDSNKSNTITNEINSDLKLSEKIRYFDENNVPVGSGPLPPKVNEKTGLRVYWQVDNNLHELNNVQVVTRLPAYVSWDDNVQTNVGNLYYNKSNHSVVWEIGKMPVSVYEIKANFGISITPSSADLNKILVLSSGTTVSATDVETKDTITKTTPPKTTKLEDDDIANLNSSGRVE